MSGVGLWAEECPKRGPALTHAHWIDCQGLHPGTGEMHFGDQCCHCLARARDWRAHNEPASADNALVPVDVTERMRMLGFAGAYAGADNPQPTEQDTGMEDIRPEEPVVAEHTDETLIEPKAITGLGPQGNPNRIGRGAFTARDAWRAHNYVLFGEWLAAHGGGER
jgi:hypothetical protein